MQQHSGQHVLSQAFVRVANLDTAAVHIGADENTLDLPTAKLSADVIERAEHEANAIVYEDRPFVVYEVTDADLARIPLRKPPKVTGLIRIVEVRDYDWSACGGTHVCSTAQIGLIKITKAEKRGNETRVTFRCGVRALRDYARLSDATTRLSELLSASRYEVEAAVNKLAAEARADRKALQDAQLKLIGYEAAELLAATAPDANGVRTIVRVFDGRDVDALRALAKQLTAAPKTVALLGAAGEKAHLVFAKSKDAPGDMGALLKRTLAALSPSARGGGSIDFAQGGGVQADAAAVRAAIEGAL
jgi:alanyl-tRNA synthetase